jgi:hypothetical protein
MTSHSFSGEIYHKMMRAEFVTEYSVPLSSDAFAAWGKYDPDYKQYEAGKRQFSDCL